MLPVDLIDRIMRAIVLCAESSQEINGTQTRKIETNDDPHHTHVPNRP
jgi:hypothetical protein